MKFTNLRLFAVPLMAGLLLASGPVVRAAVFQDSHNYSQDRDRDNKKKKKQVPEGSAGAILVLAAGALGGGLLLWRRKKGTAR
jgi:hypothetical protein